MGFKSLTALAYWRWGVLSHDEDDEDEEEDDDDGDLQPPRIFDEGDLKSTHSVAISLPLPGNHSNTDNLCQHCER